MSKKIGIISFTDSGDRLNKDLTALLKAQPENYIIDSSLRGEASLLKWTEQAFKGDALIFIGAAGIAVRAVAPFLRSKDSDPAVLVIDEKGRHVIPILSGHLGGANKLAEQIAKILGAEAVITTATDINDVFPVDSWAVENGYNIENIKIIKDVSSSLLRNEEVGISISPYLTDIFPKTLKLIPKCLVLGAGCRKNKEYSAFRDFILDFLKEKNLSLSAISDIATIDIKKDEEAIRRFADEYNLTLNFFSADELKDIPDLFCFSGSPFVEQETGVSNVCERSAVKKALEYCAEDRVRLLEKKHAENGMTAAIALYDPEKKPLKSHFISVVGIGPGNRGGLTFDALDAIESADTVIGYRVYIDLIKDMTDLSGKTVFSSEMRHERERCMQARDLALEGHNVALVCSGDAGIYGMAGLLFEVCEDLKEIEIGIVPGITAAISGAALLGSPLTNDFSVISLSDHLTPMDTILKRIRAGAEAGMVMALYNPRSKMRPDNLRRAVDVILKVIPGSTICGYVKNTGRKGQASKVCTLETLPFEDIDMFTTVFIGNKDTCIISGKMVTKRGYRL